MESFEDKGRGGLHALQDRRQFWADRFSDQMVTCTVDLQYAKDSSWQIALSLCVITYTRIAVEVYESFLRALPCTSREIGLVCMH